jgi:hypothetical protein
VANGIHVVAEGLEVRANLPDLSIHHIDPMMFPKGLPITVLNGLKGVIILKNLPKFTYTITTHSHSFKTITKFSLSFPSFSHLPKLVIFFLFKKLVGTSIQD